MRVERPQAMIQGPGGVGGEFPGFAPRKDLLVELRVVAGLIHGHQLREQHRRESSVSVPDTVDENRRGKSGLKCRCTGSQEATPRVTDK